MLCNCAITEESCQQCQCSTRENLYFTSTKAKTGSHCQDIISSRNETQRRKRRQAIQVDRWIWCSSPTAKTTNVQSISHSAVEIGWLRLGNGLQQQPVEPPEHRHGGDCLRQRYICLHSTYDAGSLPPNSCNSTWSHIFGIKFSIHWLHYIYGELSTLLTQHRTFSRVCINLNSFLLDVR